MLLIPLLLLMWLLKQSLFYPPVTCPLCFPLDSTFNLSCFMQHNLIICPEAFQGSQISCWKLSGRNYLDPCCNKTRLSASDNMMICWFPLLRWYYYYYCWGQVSCIRFYWSGNLIKLEWINSPVPEYKQEDLKLLHLSKGSAHGVNLENVDLESLLQEEPKAESDRIKSLQEGERLHLGREDGKSEFK